MIHVTIFEDYADMREVLATLIENSEDHGLVGAFSNAIDVLNIVGKQKPDVVLMDLQMPGISGIEATRLIKSKFPHVQILVQTIFDDNEHIFAALCMGARKVLTMLTENQNTHSSENDYQALSSREKEILGHLTKGRSYKMIADECGISYGTVNSHLKKIYEKLHVHSATEAVQKAFYQKIV
jgi:two-component system, NarL family, response regulator LiaR